MADHSTPIPMPMPADNPKRPLLPALTRWWPPTAPPAADPVLGYESAQPWRLDDDAGDPAGQRRY